MGIDIDQAVAIGFVLHENKDFPHIKKVVEPIYEFKPQYSSTTGERIKDKKVLKKHGYTFYQIEGGRETRAFKERHYPEEELCFSELVYVLQEILNQKLDGAVQIKYFFDQCSGEFEYMVVGLKDLNFKRNDVKYDHDIQSFPLSKIFEFQNRLQSLGIELENLGFKPGEPQLVNGFIIT